MATALGDKNPEKALRVHIEDDDKVVNKMDTTYGIKPTTFVNESGLYSPSLYDQQVEVLNVTSSIVVDEGDGTKRPTPTTSPTCRCSPPVWFKSSKNILENRNER